jgi:hypothetical protein
VNHAGIPHLVDVIKQKTLSGDLNKAVNRIGTPFDKEATAKEHGGKPLAQRDNETRHDRTNGTMRT